MKTLNIFSTTTRRAATLIALAGSIFATSCEQAEEIPSRGTGFTLENIDASKHITTSSELGFDVVAVVGDHTAEIISYDIRTDAKWSAENLSEDCDWLHIYPTSGEGDGRIRFTVNDNTLLESRSATISFAYGDGTSTETTLLVSQQANVPYFEVLLNGKAVDNITAEAAAAEYEVAINTNLDYFYNGGNSDWMSFEQNNTKNTFKVSIDENSTPTELSREEVISFKMADKNHSALNKEFAIVQDITPWITVEGSELIDGNTLPGFDAIIPPAYTIKVISNTNWEFSATPDWITISPSSGLAGNEYEVTVTAADNYSAERFGELVIKTQQVISKRAEHKIQISQYSVIADEVLGDFEGLPVKWFFDGAAGSYPEDTEEFEVNNMLLSEDGKASIAYYHTYLDEDGLPDEDCKRHLGGTGQPYITGAWPGDYWEFIAPVKNLPRSSTVRFSGVSRISGTGMRYWRLQYFDSTWKDAIEPQTVTFNGEEYTYTHDVGTANMAITADVVYRSSIIDGEVKFRFICVANCTASNGTHLNPNGGTIRFASSEETSYADSPSITLVEE